MNQKQTDELIFFIIFFIQLILYTALSGRAFRKIKEMQNIFNYIQSTSIILFILTRLFSLGYVLLDIKGERRLQPQMKIYIFFQIPQDYFNTMCLAQLFSWNDVLLTLALVINNKESDGESVLNSTLKNSTRGS